MFLSGYQLQKHQNIRCLKDKTNTIHEFCNIKKVSMCLFCYTIHPCVNIYTVRFGLEGRGLEQRVLFVRLQKSRKLWTTPNFFVNKTIMTGEPTHTTSKERNGTVRPSHQLPSEKWSIHYASLSATVCSTC